LFLCTTIGGDVTAAAAAAAAAAADDDDDDDDDVDNDDDIKETEFACVTNKFESSTWSLNSCDI
jgi:hypothetical protein